MRSTLVLALSLFAAHAQAAGNGLTASPDALGAGRWQARIEVETTTLYGNWAGQPLGQSSVVQMTRLLGDYHLDTLKFGQTSGLRLTSGLLLNPRSNLLGGEPRGTWPYFGIGYAGTGMRGDWGFSADVGLAAQNPGAVGQLGKAINGNVDFADAWRQLRIQPVIRFGVSYSF
ncbi:hypothetical protein HLB44_06640 [Aquincola sp. S2]|uniref:Outer membrane protein beta-barrel domain-containing protein n=1 Tax=Pseudaquabacterium terrae TaxID=2732868 RepID=A0ABX2ED38_9BURK|nr:hypothetical protein [Aquabacterium terrae]NRF66656.1 hypothetical protein [Aquabacterium terrae]